MNKSIIINNTGVEYQLIWDYRDNPEYRASLNRLTQETYGFDFEEWYKLGYWGDRYQPHSLVHQGEVVANVSVNPIDFITEQGLHHTLQIGTVMTKQSYRKQGLSRILMQHILEEYQKEYDLIYLYANDSVLEFYPKFGFTVAEEYEYYKRVSLSAQERMRNGQVGQTLEFVKLDGTKASDQKLIYELVSRAAVSSRYFVVGNPGLTMFYLTSFLAENLYYCEQRELLAVAEYEDNRLVLADLFCSGEFAMEDVICSLCQAPETEVCLGFTPLDTKGFDCRLRKVEGTTFFVRGDNFIHQGRLPELSHA